MSEMGRRTACVVCGKDASLKRRRFNLREFQRGETTASRGRSAAYLCQFCGDAIVDGSVLTAMQRSATGTTA